MPTRRVASLVRVGSVAALLLGLGACTPGGQFDPTELLSIDIFNTKKPLQGEREPLFPNGVPGAETGVPPDLVKGYQPPPEQAADNTDAAAAAAKAAAAPAKPKTKPKPKPAVAHTAPPPQDAAWDQKPASMAPAPAAQSPWPNPPQAGPAQTNWPTGQAQQAAQPAQTNWPAPPPAGQGQQTAQPAQSAWPNPPTSSPH